MSYSSKITRIFVEMPTFDDDELALGNQPDHEKDINDRRLASLTRLSRQVGKINLPDNVSIEMLENKSQSNFNVYLIQTLGGKRHVVGNLDIIENGFPYPSVQMSFVDKEFQGKGYSKLMYKMAIRHLGGLVSDAHLTGEKSHGSFNVWVSLGKEFFTYVIDENGEVHEVGNFDRTMMNSDETRFMVAEDEIEENPGNY